MSAETVKKTRGFWSKFLDHEPNKRASAEKIANQKVALKQPVPAAKKDSKTMFESFYNEDKKFELLGRVFTALSSSDQTLDLKMNPAHVDAIIKIGFEAGLKFGRANPLVHSPQTPPIPAPPLAHN